MPWDGLDLTAGGGARLSLANALTAEFTNAKSEVVAVNASLAKGRAYLAIRCDGAVYPAYLWLAPHKEFGGNDDSVVMYKAIAINESPGRWPRHVAAAITRWE